MTELCSKCMVALVLVISTSGFTKSACPFSIPPLILVVQVPPSKARSLATTTSATPPVGSPPSRATLPCSRPRPVTSTTATRLATFLPHIFGSKRTRSSWKSDPGVCVIACVSYIVHMYHTPVPSLACTCTCMYVCACACNCMCTSFLGYQLQLAWPPPIFIVEILE